PFTTLVTRLMETTCSLRFNACGSIRLPVAIIRSKLQSAFAGGFRQGLHAAVIQIPAAIEHYLLNTALPSALGDQPADLARRRHVAATALAGLLDGRGRHQRLAFRVVDELRIDVRDAPEHCQSRPRRRPPHFSANPLVNPNANVVLGSLLDHLLPAAFPTFLRSISPVYRMPLFLYGSGGRSARISAAT